MEHMGAWVQEIQRFTTAQLAGGLARTSTYTRRQHLQHVAKRVTCGPWDLSADDLAAYMAAQEWARETRRGRLTTLAEFYRWGLRNGHTENDPTSTLPKVRAGDPTPRPVPDEIYLEALIRADADEALWIDLAAEHGLRRAEIACIHSSDIVKTLLGYDLIVHGKGNKLRDVPLTNAMSRALLARDRGYLFPGDEGGHVSARWLGRRINRLLDGGYTIHKLRHRAATRFWIASGGDPYVVADIMGWANLSMVRRYVKLPDERKRSVVESASRVGVPVGR